MDATDPLELCVRTCEACAETCEQALRSDPAYADRAGRFTVDQICLITCADVCRVTAAGVRERRPGFVEVCAWCADVCESIAGSATVAGKSMGVIPACRACASMCREIDRSF